MRGSDTSHYLSEGLDGKLKFKWSEGGVISKLGGRREEEEETEICSNTPPYFPSYFTRNMNYWWLAAEFPLTLFSVFE